MVSFMLFIRRKRSNQVNCLLMILLEIKFNLVKVHNPATEAFSLLFQWLVASPIVILDKVNQWDLRTKKYGFRVYPCPETPFSVEWDAFRDWHYFEIKWGNDPSDWNMQSNITGNGSNQVHPDNNIAINADVI